MVGFKSIKYQSNTEENWTASLRYLLINLKHILSWMAQGLS